MANFYNTLGSSTFVGTSLQDTCFAFTRDADLDHALADEVRASLVWTTAVKQADGTALSIAASDIQISTDVLLGFERSDVLYGSNLNDLVVYNDGAFKDGFGGFDSIEQFWLGAGNDLIDLAARAGGADYAKDVVVNAGAGNDTVLGGAGKDSLNGDSGDDLIFGYRGADTLAGGMGDDTLYGDDLGYNGIAGDDMLRGQAGNDTLYGGARSDRLEGGDGADQLYGGLGGDNLSGGSGDDVLQGDDPGTNGNDTLSGDAGNDQLFGGGGNDSLDGGSGNDALDGGDGSDFLSGGAGDDALTGGAGQDRFHAAVGSDRLLDFGAGEDALDYRPLGLSQTPVGQLAGYFSFEAAGADTVLRLDREGVGDFAAPEATVTVAGVDLVEGETDQTTIISSLINDFILLV